MVFDLQLAHRTPVHRVGWRRSAPAGARRSTPARSARVGSAADVLELQRTAGNRAVSRVLGVQRVAPALITVGPVGVNNQRISVPIPRGVALQATVPRDQTVDWSLVAGTAAIGAGTAIDATGLVTFGDAQQGGTITIRAEHPTETGVLSEIEVLLIKAPGGIDSTVDNSPALPNEYGAGFRHTFAPLGGGAGSECEGGRVNEIFPGVPSPNDTRHRMPGTPFGTFVLHSNNPRDVHAGWEIDASGQMMGDDYVTIGRDVVNIRPFITNTSNPAPPQTLPAKISVTQNLRSPEVPTNTWRAAFATPEHKRELRETSPGTPEFVVTVNGVEHVDTYTGAAAVRNAQADPTTVAVSTPEATNTVAITAESTPTDSPIRFRIVGPALGCTIDASTGQLTVGTRPGTIRVRASIDRRNFDEVTITITR
ncbi:MULTISPECIES: hypothetical protein [unclassified Saccharothrix]|uniref:hypothetical protein n=1 Tax=unclassified Saccharothrix TaxID=2593673 RepID=UPI00307D0963